MSQLVRGDDYIVQALGSFLQRYLGTDLTVARGYINRVSKPAGPEYALITPMGAVRLATNLHEWHDNTLTVTMPARRSVQIDFYGQRADVLSLTAATLLRDGLGCSYLKDWGIAPLFVEDPRDLSSPDGREQWARRWMVNVMIQANAQRTVPQEYFNNVNLSLHPQA